MSADANIAAPEVRSLAAPPAAEEEVGHFHSAMLPAAALQGLPRLRRVVSGARGWVPPYHQQRCPQGVHALHR